MHGSIFYGFKQFVVQRQGPEVWKTVATAARTEGWYHPTKSYPDEELAALVHAAAVAEGRSLGATWEEFGMALVPNLVDVYRAYLDPTWRTLDLLENVERVIHRTVRMQDEAASPPHLRPKRISADEVHIEYASARRLCQLAVGICRGVAAHYGEMVTVDHSYCMLAGSAHCLLIVRLLASEMLFEGPGLGEYPADLA